MSCEGVVEPVVIGLARCCGVVKVNHAPASQTSGGVEDCALYPRAVLKVDPAVDRGGHERTRRADGQPLVQVVEGGEHFPHASTQILPVLFREIGGDGSLVLEYVSISVDDPDLRLDYHPAAPLACRLILAYAAEGCGRTTGLTSLNSDIACRASVVPSRE